MSYWKKCLSTGEYQYIATGEPAPEDIKVPWWEVDLARKDKRIAELEQVLRWLEAQVSGYAHVLDDAYDGYMSASSTEELVEVLKEVIEYAPRREK